MTRRIFRHVFPDTIQIVAPPPGKGFKFSCDQGQHFKELVRRLDRRIHDDFTNQRHAAGLGQKRKRKACCQAKALLLVASAAIETQFQVGSELAAGWKVREIDRPVKDIGRNPTLGYAAQLLIRQAESTASRGDVRGAPQR